MNRVKEIIKKMTLEQKIAQLQCMLSLGSSIDSSACPHGLGEGAIMPVGMTKEELAQTIEDSRAAIAKNAEGVSPAFHVETLTGVSIAEATVFPSAIGLGATFNPKLVGEVAAVIHDQAVAAGFHQALAPVLDVCRDQRWGRIGETYGEDPTLCALIGTSYVKGLQGGEGEMIAATGKHFLGYGLSAGGLNMATCMASMSEIREVYAKPFQAAMTEAGMISVMNSYGTIDGEMVIGSEKILTELLRNEMEFEGTVISDYASIEHLVDHRLAADMREAGQQALQAGLDIECPIPIGYSFEHLISAVKNGEISEELIDRSVLRILEKKRKLGLLEKGKRNRKSFSCYNTEESWSKSLQAARESIVLLKNDGILPLQKIKQKIAVIGPHADNIRLVFGGYTFAAGTDMMIGGSLADQAGMDTNVNDLAEATMKVKKDVPMYPQSSVECDNAAAIEAVAAAYPYTKTILSCICEKNPEAEVTYLRGCDVAGKDRSQFEAASQLAKTSDIVIMTVGGKYGWGGSCTIGEGIDSDDIGLTGVQEELALNLIETGTPVIVVHMDARPLSSPAIVEKASAILENWFPGTTGGKALSDVLFGDYNPAGRLSVTVPRNVGQIPIYNGQYTGNSYYSKECSTCSCRYVDSEMEPLFYFGQGLSYSNFTYSDLQVLNQEVSAEETVFVSCKVKNTGTMDGEEVVQLYVSDLQASKLRPYQEFAGCARIVLKVGEEKTVFFSMRADQFAFVGKDGNWIVEAGDMMVKVGGSSVDLPLQKTFRITDTTVIRPAKRGFYANYEIK
ncbi:MULTISPECIES: glycoside hydrolase family 3 N-terminal domain-containing protein [Clostridia]|uniref:glycoside hydrolase family 3 N-terminal domain-containing protein n=1 Tax=Clostridia TaxID=186801 RepID=UPI00067E7FB9|nr:MULTISPECIES: glycoside hydrolase family 3 N-terminal domain-containing protein [Clostridia]